AGRACLDGEDRALQIENRLAQTITRLREIRREERVVALARRGRGRCRAFVRSSEGERRCATARVALARAIRGRLAQHRGRVEAARGITARDRRRVDTAT